MGWMTLIEATVVVLAFFSSLLLCKNSLLSCCYVTAGCIEFPVCLHHVAITLFQIMTGNSILKDGRSVVEVYGVDLDKLKEGERIGVMRTSEVTDCKPQMYGHIDIKVRI